MIDVARPEFMWLLLLIIPFAGLSWFSRRKISPGRRRLAFGARALLLIALVLALSELTWKRPVDDLAVVFVVDRSASVGSSGHQQALDFVDAAVARQGEQDRAGVVVFGADALVEREPQEALQIHGFESNPIPHQTDIASALRLGTALLPADRTRRIVLLTDGEQNRGDAAAQALLTAGDDLRISVASIGAETGSEVLLEDLIVRPRVDQGAAFDVKVVANAMVPAEAKLRLYRNKTYLGEMPVSLDGKRAQILTFRQEASEPGLYRYRASLEVDPSLDQLPQNNQVVATVQVSGHPRILYITGDPARAGHLSEALSGEGIDFEGVGIADAPHDLAGLRPYSAIFLSDVPAYALSRRQQQALHAFVRDMGRGLVMIGSDQSFGVGGYYGTPIEDALPVRMDLEDKTRFPKLGMVLAIDKSGSMGSGSKMELAKEAAIQTADLLSDRDMLGIIGFDGAASWITPLDDLSDRQAVLDNIAALRPGGGTHIYPALKTATEALRSSDAALKHMILLSDGMTTPGDYESLITGALADNITLTTVVLGQESDTAAMEQFSSWGGGSHYAVVDDTAIPAIFTRETLLATRSFLIEEPFRPVMGHPSDITRGLASHDFPTLYGLVATEPKARAITALYSPSDTEEEAALPLLSHWQYGLGRSVAFTSDAKTRWSAEWVGSESYTRLWTQLARWVIGDRDASNLAVETEIREGRLLITVDAFDGAGGFANFLDGRAKIIAPDLKISEVELTQIAPGRYQTDVPVDQDGSWMVAVSLEDGDHIVGQAVEEAIQPYSPEYRSTGAGDGLREDLGRIGGGGVIDDPAQVFARPEVPRQVPRPLWPPLIGLAGFLLLFDVAIRRLDLGRGTGGQVFERAIAAPSAAGAFRTAPAAPVPPDEPDHGPSTPEGDRPPTAEVPPESYAGRLLAARRAARKKMDE